jgi:MFS family permease
MLIQGVLGGMGVGLLFVPAMSIQTQWFSRHRNLAIGIVASGSSLGGIAFPSSFSLFPPFAPFERY